MYNKFFLRYNDFIFNTFHPDTLYFSSTVTTRLQLFHSYGVNMQILIYIYINKNTLKVSWQANWCTWYWDMNCTSFLFILFFAESRSFLKKHYSFIFTCCHHQSCNYYCQPRRQWVYPINWICPTLWRSDHWPEQTRISPGKSMNSNNRACTPSGK